MNMDTTFDRCFGNLSGRLCSGLLIQMVLDLKSNCADWKAELMMGILYLLNGGLAIYLSGDHLILVSRLIGCYLLLQAIQGFMEMFFFPIHIMPDIMPFETGWPCPLLLSVFYQLYTMTIC